jgi:hypothetical protein
MPAVQRLINQLSELEDDSSIPKFIAEQSVLLEQFTQVRTVQSCQIIDDIDIVDSTVFI